MPQTNHVIKKPTAAQGSGHQDLSRHSTATPRQNKRTAPDTGNGNLRAFEKIHPTPARSTWGLTALIPPVRDRPFPRPLPALRVRGMLDATGPSRPRNAGRYRPFASAECWTLPALRVRGMLDATGPSRPRNAGRYRPFASAECWTLPALRVRGMLDATGPYPSVTPRPSGKYGAYCQK